MFAHNTMPDRVCVQHNMLSIGHAGTFPMIPFPAEIAPNPMQVFTSPSLTFEVRFSLKVKMLFKSKQFWHTLCQNQKLNKDIKNKLILPIGHTLEFD